MQNTVRRTSIPIPPFKYKDQKGNQWEGLIAAGDTVVIEFEANIKTRVKPIGLHVDYNCACSFGLADLTIDGASVLISSKDLGLIPCSAFAKDPVAPLNWKMIEPGHIVRLEVKNISGGGCWLMGWIEVELP